MRVSTFCLVYGLVLVLAGAWAWGVSWPAGADALGVASLVLAVGAGVRRSHSVSRM